LTSSTKRLHVFVHGRVQGVGFRAATAAEAVRRGLAGWVRNRFDDSVEVVAEGEELPLQEFLSFLRLGPRLARVDRIVVDWPPAGAAGEAPVPFEVRKTA
jgi:acylphosphatase